MNKFLHLIIAFTFLVTSNSPIAIPINDVNELDRGHTRINFNELRPDIIVSNQYQASGVIISGSRGMDGKGAPTDVFSSSLFDFTTIGIRDSQLDSSIILDFSVPVTQFAAFIIDPKPGNLTVYDDSNNLIESLSLTENVIEGFAGVNTGDRFISRAIISGNRFSLNEILFNTAKLSTGLEVDISVTSDWGEGYCVELLISNTSSDTISEWSISLDTNAATLSESRWNAEFSDVSGSIIISGLYWNNTIAAGETDNTIGFCAYRDNPDSTTLPLIE
ncbi:cellulose binding domain-containing protein [Agarilytica rhodophyticola]|uniref:cellulose binding domain-containing protein n=1 Tax=Agarilytica rhodophyticola TaxID=1737490 RepID=UPI000B3478DC|nr:cellulose binding domain-containing protein [Agarilytica rhodophyticola]